MNIFQVSKPENIVLENQAKFIQERLMNTEDHLSSLCSALNLYARRAAKMRDAGDSLASSLHHFSCQESVNATLKRGLEQLAENLACVGDSRDCSVVELEHKVVKPLVEYGSQCKNAKGELKNIMDAKRKEMNKRRRLVKMKRKCPSNLRTILKAESSLTEACSEVSRMQQALEEHSQIFERKKLADLKKTFMNFINAELAFHVDGVRLYTKAYQDLCEINVEQDFKEFQDILRQPPAAHRIDTIRQVSPGNVIGGPVSPKYEDESQLSSLKQQDSPVDSEEDETTSSGSDALSEM